ncbi:MULTISPECIES: hypothetical protein [unclassified Arthrobacter]|uniref:hypothetical protein n=1 Tax=unclassified Arthrobacter TaxID=235627 RepID=UPI0015E48E21|nr:MULTISPECIES: hypothetical protein [unclassified Arthrobacter]
MLEAMHRIGLPGGRSASFRLTTRPLDQGLASMPTDEMLVERRRWHAGTEPLSRACNLLTFVLAPLP